MVAFSFNKHFLWSVFRAIYTSRYKLSWVRCAVQAHTCRKQIHTLCKGFQAEKHWNIWKSAVISQNVKITSVTTAEKPHFPTSALWKHRIPPALTKQQTDTAGPLDKKVRELAKSKTSSNTFSTASGIRLRWQCRGLHLFKNKQINEELPVKTASFRQRHYLFWVYRGNTAEKVESTLKWLHMYDRAGVHYICQS